MDPYRRLKWHRFYYRNRNGIFAAAVVVVVCAGLGAEQASDTMADAVPVTAVTKPAPEYYPNCAAARAAGVAPIMRGEPGYRLELDADNDGIACEPWRYSHNQPRPF